MATPPALSSNLRTLLAPIAKPKLRSHETSLASHLPLIQSNPSNPPTIIFLGDSMFERFITTGSSPNFPAPWPSPTLLPSLPPPFPPFNSPADRLPHVLNAGVGGDKIQNMAYRLLGNDAPAQPLPSLAAAIADLKSVKLWAIHAGTNNLTPKKGLADGDVQALEAMLRVVLSIDGAPGVRTRVVVTALHYRRDVPDGKVDEANGKLRGLVGRLDGDEELGRGRVSWLGPARGVVKEEHLVDHVHLSLEGYRVWVGEERLANSSSKFSGIT
ncbi:SGNH hydrolase-type esterase domain-containing protein [Podospora aff. communis PSN243]|uniref:SGNH hydrolase-type esterase domain-containing protein n=1 Tax=Podospora aff. communis PSN243 TaxID=3040156 RepID=A0AAV9GR96_9PEZI|nr:SGNH hydrolase-type esterase domain-containing protein [Podospora aff. communis PSN243]